MTTATTEAAEVVHAERGETPVVRRPGSTGLVDSLDGMRTVQQIFERGVSRYADLPCIGTRALDEQGRHTGPYVWTTYKEFAVMVGNFGRGLVARFPAPPSPPPEPQQRLVGLYSVNRAEWAIADMACVSYGFVGVPLYDSLGPSAVRDIIAETELPVAVCSRDKTAKLLEIAAALHTLRLIIQMEDVSPSDLEKWGSTIPEGTAVVSFSDISRAGTQQDAADPLAGRIERRPEDLHTIIYTSGTSNGPKGVLLRNSAFVAGIGGTIDHLRGVFVEGQESILSFLPLAHILERQVFVIAMYWGARTGYFGGHISSLMNDLAALRPTVFFAVPRLFNKVYAGFQDKLRQKPLPLRLIFRAAFAWKASCVGGRQQQSFSSVVDFAFAQLREGLGGRVKLIITGSAPLSPEIHRFMQVCFACPVLQGYGMTEGYPVSVTGIEDADPLHCGPLMAHCELKLRDVPELGYSVRDKPFPRGEALIRGPHLFSGYFRRPEQTAAAMTSDGWYCTGDVIELIDGDRLRIIGRCKEVIKLAQGEFVVIEALENLYGVTPIVAQIFVYGDPSRDCLVAVVVPHKPLLLQWWRKLTAAEAASATTVAAPAAAAAATTTTTTDNDENEFRRACEDPRAAEFVLRTLDKVHADSGMSGITRLKAVYLEPQPFSTETGVVTPTTKLAREGAKRYYAGVIERLYASLAPPSV